jgi:hypothetical protein
MRLHLLHSPTTQEFTMATKCTDYRGGTDYYGRFIHLPADHPDNYTDDEYDYGADDDDDGDLTKCECVTGCEPD